MIKMFEKQLFTKIQYIHYNYIIINNNFFIIDGYEYTLQNTNNTFHDIYEVIGMGSNIYFFT